MLFPTWLHYPNILPGFRKEAHKHALSTVNFYNDPEVNTLSLLHLGSMSELKRLSMENSMYLAA
jgi:hypothetical protein